MAWNEFKANHLNKILREDLDREFEVDLKSHSDIYQPSKDKGTDIPGSQNAP